MTASVWASTQRRARSYSSSNRAQCTMTTEILILLINITLVSLDISIGRRTVSSHNENQPVLPALVSPRMICPLSYHTDQVLRKPEGLTYPGISVANTRRNGNLPNRCVRQNVLIEKPNATTWRAHGTWGGGAARRFWGGPTGSVCAAIATRCLRRRGSRCAIRRREGYLRILHCRRETQ